MKRKREIVKTIIFVKRFPMEFIADELANYCENHTSPESDLLYELNRHTHLNELHPRMLSGHIQGRFLSFQLELDF
jgi:hypothetical protein